MKTKALIIIAALLISLFLSACSQKEAPQSKAPKDLLKWNSLQEGMKRAMEEDKLIFLSVHADWCHPCHILEAEVYQTEVISQELNKNFVSVKVDFEADTPLPCGGKLKDAKLCLEEDWKDPDQITALPFIVFLKPTGERVFSHLGQISQTDLLLLLNEMETLK